MLPVFQTQYQVRFANDFFHHHQERIIRIMAANQRNILVTCALPYANGSIHLGHMLEHIQADVWVRYQRLRGNNIHFICADDAHGTPIMLKAQQLSMEPEQMIAGVQKEHEADFAGFDISFDNYHSTHSDENRELASYIYNQLKNSGYITSRTISQLFDPEKEMFLPDRFVKAHARTVRQKTSTVTTAMYVAQRTAQLN